MSISPVVIPGRRNTRSGREAGSTIVLVTYDRGILKKFTGMQIHAIVPNNLWRERDWIAHEKNTSAP